VRPNRQRLEASRELGVGDDASRARYEPNVHDSSDIELDAHLVLAVRRDVNTRRSSAPRHASRVIVTRAERLWESPYR
jgi:hypothetical protein